MIDENLWIALLMLFGAWLLYTRKKRKFNRLSKQGIEEFRSYTEKLKADTFDYILLWLGYTCLFGSVLMLLGIDFTALGWILLSVLALVLILSNRNHRK